MAGHTPQEQRRLGLYLPHDRGGPGGQRQGGRGHSPRRTLPGGERGQDTPAGHRRESAGSRYRAARQPLFRHRHPGRHRHLQQGEGDRPRALHRRQPGVREREEPEPPAPPGHRPHRRRLSAIHRRTARARGRRGAICLCGHPGRYSGERLQPQYTPLCRYLRRGGRGRYSGRAARNRCPRAGVGPGAGPDERLLERVGALTGGRKV